MNAAVAVGGTVAVAGAATVYYCSKGDKDDNSHQMLPSGSGSSTIGGTVPAAPAARRTVIFDSVAAAETWVTENGWTCLLCVGNSAAGYTEQSFQASQALAPPNGLAASHTTLCASGVCSQSATAAVRELLEGEAAGSPVGALCSGRCISRP